MDWSEGAGSLGGSTIFVSVDTGGGDPPSEQFAQLYLFARPASDASPGAIPTPLAHDATVVTFADGVARPAFVITDDQLADSTNATKGLSVSHTEGSVTIEVVAETTAECFDSRESQLRSLLALVDTPHEGSWESYVNSTPVPEQTPQEPTPTP